jgi:group I intron endonuclease
MQYEAYADGQSDAGIYAICDTTAGRCYVGSSPNLAACLTAHLNTLSTDMHPCEALQAAWNADGESTFEFTVLELVDHGAQLHACEQHWLNTLCPLGLYNSEHCRHDSRRGEPLGGRLTPRPTDHATTASVQINAATGNQRVITSEECRAVFQARPRVRNVMRRVLAEAYMREHAESRVVLQSILEDWEQAF